MFIQVLTVPKNEDLKSVNQDTETYYVSDYNAEDENTHHGGGNKGMLLF